jgi:hypothetical protein
MIFGIFERENHNSNDIINCGFSTTQETSFILPTMIDSKLLNMTRNHWFK